MVICYLSLKKNKILKLYVLWQMDWLNHIMLIKIDQNTEKNQYVFLLIHRNKQKLWL